MSDLGNKEIFAKNLKYYMDYYKKDRNDICKDLDIPYTTFTDWCNSVTYPRIDKIELLANYFNIQKSDLIENKYKQDNVDELDVLYSKSKGILNETEIDMIKHSMQRAIERYEEQKKNGGI